VYFQSYLSIIKEYAPAGIRTRIAALEGQNLSRWTTGAYSDENQIPFINLGLLLYIIQINSFVFETLLMLLLLFELRFQPISL
jgi:hypothetical protein